MSQNQNDTNSQTAVDNLDNALVPIEESDNKCATKLSKPCNSEGSIKNQGFRQKLVNKVKKSWTGKDSKGHQNDALITQDTNSAEAALVSDIQTLNLSPDNLTDNLCTADWLRARDSLENLLSPRSNKPAGGEVISSKSAHIPKQTKSFLADSPHSESLIGNKGPSSSVGAKILTWDPWDKLGRKVKDNRNRKSEKVPQNKESEDNLDACRIDPTTGDETRENSDLPDKSKLEESYEYQPYRQPKTTKSVEFTNKVLVVYFNCDEVVCESTEPLKKEHDQQIRNKEMRMGHTPATLVITKRRCLDNYMDAWFKK